MGVFFYGYDETLSAPVSLHAEQLLRFLGEIFPSPSSEIFRPSFAPQEKLRPEEFKYRKLVLTGHSEGAVVMS